MKPTREQKIQWARDAGAGFACETLLVDGKDADDLLCRLIDIAYAAGQASNVPEGWKLVPSRCPMCEYQHGHAIGCKNNPVDIALRNLAAPPQETGK